MDIPSKRQRLREVYTRLLAAAPATTLGEAHRRLCEIITQVEDEFTPYPNDPALWTQFPRIFPPDDAFRKVLIPDLLVRYDHFGHITYIAANGAIEIRRRTSPTAPLIVDFSMPGADGRRVGDVCPQLQNQNL